MRPFSHVVRKGNFKPLSSTTKVALVLSCLLISLSLPHLALSHERPLKIVGPWEMKSSDPAVSGSIFLQMEIVETLVDFDHQGNELPGLATKWSVSEDGLSWTFSIRQGVTFHNGTDLTAETVANALQIASQKPGLLKKAPIHTIDHRDNNVRIHLIKPFSILDSVLSHYSTCILAPASYIENGKVKEVIGTGPYMVDSFEPPQKLKATVFDSYWGAQPAIKATQYLAVSRNETRALMAQSGDADIVFTLDPTTRKRLQNFSNISIATISLPRTVVIKLNCDIPGLDTPELRKALSDGLDREGIALSVMRLKEAAAYELFPEMLGKWHLHVSPEGRYGKSMFKGLLTAKGWKENTEGILEKDGKPFKLTIVTYADRPELPVAATALQDQMRKMGIKLNVSISNSSAIPQQHQEGTLEMGLLARNYGHIATPMGDILEDYGPEGGDWGAMNWRNENMQKALEGLQHTSDTTEQNSYIQTISTLLQEEMPTIPVVSYQSSAALNKDLTGFSLDPLERCYKLSKVCWEGKH